MMFFIHITKPTEPDWHKCYKTFSYVISMWIEFKRTDYTHIVSADLNKYYDWAETNGIDMKHSIVRLAAGDGTGMVAFMFNHESYCMAFKLRWK